MYRYNHMDARFVRERVAEFRDQVRRRLAGELSEDEFRPLRLMNGLYIQRHAYMLRIAIPYGMLNSTQVRKLGHIAEHYDRGFGHMTTRQNIQFNWIKLADVPDILDHLADVEMHAIQTSGNCVRNISSDPHSGVAHDEILDMRPLCELIRQYSSCHPEFMYLPRKFKIAMSGSLSDRAAVAFHDIGVRAAKEDGEIGLRVYAGGGLGRTPRVGQVVRDFLPIEDLMSYCEAILRVYNLHGRRDNKYKARIKILVGDLGIEEFRRQVEAEWQHVKHNTIDMTRLAEIAEMFDVVTYELGGTDDTTHRQRAASDPAFAKWFEHNVRRHKVPGYSIVYLSLKTRDVPPGDIQTQQFYGIADLMDRYNSGYCSAVYNQNLLFQFVQNKDLPALFDALVELDLATPNMGTVSDLICCPGLDYCSLANSSSIPVAHAMSERFSDQTELDDLGPLEIKMSGCINACGHHHIGHIGLLGIDKRGEEYYQIVVGGSAGTSDTDYPSVGEIIGPAVSQKEVVGAVDKLLDCYRDKRNDGEAFLETYRRLGPESFKEYVYDNT
jgi:sulfite reductase (NADPH) hemoprotein beta-component